MPKATEKHTTPRLRKALATLPAQSAADLYAEAAAARAALDAEFARCAAPDYVPPLQGQFIGRLQALARAFRAENAIRALPSRQDLRAAAVVDLAAWREARS